ncbi:MAG: hypothetical protein J6V80_00915 [Clostridia bacterium]|nr:hypothetical protein [Clostridia bacterium]
MIPKIVLFALMCAILSALLEGLGFKGKGLFSLLCIVLMLISLTDTLTDTMGGILSLADKVGISNAASAAVKAIGLGYTFGFVSDLCASLGEGVLASAVTAAGRINIFLVAYPYFESIVKLGMELLE